MAGFGPFASRPVASVPAGVTGVVYSLTGGYARFQGVSVTVTYSFPPSKVTWSGVEVLHPGNAQTRVTWSGVETLHEGNAETRVTWVGVEVLRSVDGVTDSGFISILW